VKGSCLFKAVKYEIFSLDMSIIFCPCQICCKVQGAPFVPSAVVTKENFRWLRCEEKISNFESYLGKVRRFSSVCGPHLVAKT
jgi:hypothetical protein